MRLSHSGRPVCSSHRPPAATLRRPAHRFDADVAGDAIVTGMYGAMSGIHDDLQYKPMSVAPEWFDRFLRESIEKGIVDPGECDFLIVFPSGHTLTLCHEKDVHVEAETAEAVEAFIAGAAFRSLVGDVTFTRR